MTFAQDPKDPLSATLIDAGNLLQMVCHATSVDAGWWKHKATGLDLIAVLRKPDGPLMELLAGALVAQKLCLSHSEISEAMEGHRKGLQDDKLPHRPMIEVEIADAIIRLFDLAGALNLDVGGAIVEKMEFNKRRPDHKPEARAAAGGKAYQVNMIATVVITLEFHANTEPPSNTQGDDVEHCEFVLWNQCDGFHLAYRAMYDDGQFICFEDFTGRSTWNPGDFQAWARLPEVNSSLYEKLHAEFHRKAPEATHEN